MISVPITTSFDQRPDSILGTADFNEVSAIWDIFIADPSKFVFAPSYVRHVDGTIELLEISLIPVGNVVTKEKNAD